MGFLVAALATCKALPMSYNRDLQEATPNLWRSSVPKGWRPPLARASRRRRSSPTPPSERRRSTSKTAHQIVGALAAKGETPKIRDLEGAAERIAGFLPSERGFGEEELKSALDPRENVALRSRIGGPAPAETKRMIADRVERIEENGRVVGEMRGESRRGPRIAAGDEVSLPPVYLG